MQHFRKLTLLMAMLCALALNTTATHAKPGGPPDALLNSIDVTGTAEEIDGPNSYDFSGSIRLINLDLSTTSTVEITGIINGVAINGDTIEINNQVFTTSATLESIGGEGRCEMINLVLEPIRLEILDLVVDLSDVQLDVAAERGPSRLLGNLLCAFARHMEKGAEGPAGRFLDRINAIIGDPLSAIPVEGDLVGDGEFIGYLIINQIALDEDNRLIFSGWISGMAIIGTEPIPVVNRSFEVVGILEGEGRGRGHCDMLTLDLEVIELEDPGLSFGLPAVQLPAVQLPAVQSARSGRPGQLLATLLCQLVVIHDHPGRGKSIHSLLEHINELID